MSHLACPDMPEYPLNKLQLDRFKEIAQHFPNSDKSLAASSGITLGPEFHFDEVRIGVYLYGFLSNPHPHPGLHLTPAIKARAQILEVKNVEKGVSIGYDATFISTKKMKIGTISAGYADGIPLSYTNKGVFMLNNHPVPIIGRVSMDLCVVDLSDVPAKLAKVGKWVDLIPDPVSFCKASKEAGCSPREILTRFGQRYNRIYEK
ncbi:MAG: alanine racemase [Holosporaceae bacterium]|nr:MAG: alanine racemase [Holosporaceae bacterium]